MEKTDSLEISCFHFMLTRKAAAEKTVLLVLLTISGLFPLPQVAHVED